MKRNAISHLIQSSLHYFRVEVKPSVNIIITIFSASATIAQIAAISQVKIIVFLAIFNFFALFFFILFISLKRIPRPEPTKAEIKYIESAFDENEIHFRYARDDIDLAHVWKIDNELYGSYNVDEKTFLSWFNKFHSGSLLMFRGPRFIGYIAIQPLKKEA